VCHRDASLAHIHRRARGLLRARNGAGVGGPYVRAKMEPAWHGKWSSVSGMGNGAARGGLRLCEQIPRMRGLGLGGASGRVLRPGASCLECETCSILVLHFEVTNLNLFHCISLHFHLAPT